MEAPVWQHFPWFLITRVGWPRCSGSGREGPRDVTVLLHCSALPGVRPGLFHWLILAAGRANLDLWLDLGTRVNFKAEQRCSLLANVARNCRLGYLYPQAQRSPREPHLSILLVTQHRHGPIPAMFSCTAHAIALPKWPIPIARPHATVRNNPGEKQSFKVKTSQEHFLDSCCMRFSVMC